MFYSGRNLEVLSSRTGARIAAHEFGEPDSVRARVTTACEIKFGKEHKLLIGYEDEVANLLCVFDIKRGILTSNILFPQSVK